MKVVNGVRVSISHNRIKKRQPEVKAMHWLIMLLVMLLTVSFTVGLAVAEQKFSPKVLSQIEALYKEKMSRTAVEKKVSSHLLYAAKMRRGESIASGLPMFRNFVKVDDNGTVKVDIRVTSITARLLDRVVNSGGMIISSSSKYNRIRARVSLESIMDMAALEEVKNIRPAIQAITNRAIAKAITNKVNTSEGDVAHAADVARTTFGVDGTGVKIGVLSDGVDSLATIQGSGDLPATVTVLSGQAGSGDEGTAMLEIVHDLAPGADLFFATAFTSQASFAQNILDLRTAGCDVIVDDVFYFDEGVFQDDIIAQAVNDVTADGALYFSSAGNSGNKNDGTSGVWEGNFVNGGEIFPDPDPTTAHDFGGGDLFNQITKNAPSAATLHWSDPLGGSSNDYDLCVVDPSLSVGCANDTQDGDDDPFEIIPDEIPAGYSLLVLNFNNAAAPRYLHLNTNRGQLEINTDGQTAGHAAAVDAFGVAAVDVATAGGGAFDGNEPVETFSSDGLRRVFFKEDGTPITPGDFTSTGGEVRQKPDIAAADGVSTAAPGFNPFFGTSAAAPHAAAIAGLLLSNTPKPTPQQVRQALTTTALDIETPGVDRDSGHGIIMADLALAALVGGGVCGDGTVNPGEECDDGNTTSGDGCSSTCEIEIQPKSFLIKKATLKQKTTKTDTVQINIKEAEDLSTIINKFPDTDLLIELAVDESTPLVFYQLKAPGSSVQVKGDKAKFKSGKTVVTLNGKKNTITINDKKDFTSEISSNKIKLTIEAAGALQKYEFSGDWEEKDSGKQFKLKNITVSP